MQMIKIQIADRADRAKALETLTLRGRVICLPDNQFVVPEPALEMLKSLQITFQELGRGWAAQELRALPPAERDKILEAAAACAERDYREDRSLTDFQAFGKDDLHVDSSSTEAR